MTRYIVVVLLVTIWTGFRMAAASCFPAPSGLVGWWPGEGNASDITGTNNGTLQNGATAGAAGLVGSAFGFDGTNGFVQFTDSPVFHPTNLTVEAWARFSSLDSAGSGTSPAGEQYLIFKQNTRGSDFEGFDLGKVRVGSSDFFRFTVTSAAGQPAELHSATVVTTGVWYHITGVRGTNFTQLYVNGQLERQTNVTFAQDYGSLPLYFGTSGQSYWDHKFNGTLDEVSLYNRPLSSNEIFSIYAAGAAGKCGPPRITVQPQSQAVAAGSNATFNVSAAGADPLSYQWRFNGADIIAATTASLAVTNAQSTNAGNYLVVITNSVGAITSAVAVLSVLTPPAITAPPASRTNLAGTAATFNASASGTAPLGYQWQLNSSNVVGGGRITGATSTNLTISAVQPADAGYYTLLASNAVGVATSAAATLTVLFAPAITTQPANLSAVIGSNASFTVTASGTAPLSYQWRFGGTELPGATGTILTLTNVQPASAGNYTVVVTNSIGVATSAVAVLTVLVPSQITSQPASQTNVAGATSVFSASATGTGPLGYQWQFNGANLGNGGRISGATSNNLALTGTQPGDAGTYVLVVSNVAGVATSLAVTLTVVVPPAITAQPSGWDVVAGTNVSFAVTASGNLLTYQWQRNGATLTDAGNVSGAASAALTISNVQTNDSANYEVVITNIAGAATSAVANLAVTLAPVAPGIITPPASQLVTVGDDVMFAALATGTMPLSYQWQKDGGTLADGSGVVGASSSTMTLHSVSQANAGNYQVTVTNIAGGVTSAVAELTINPPVRIGADAVVLVNSMSSKYPDFQHFIQPYLDNSGIPYSILDIATNSVGTNIGRYALIVVGHGQLDTNHAFLSTANQAALSVAVSNGTGLVSFDPDLSAGGGVPRYHFVQDIFGFTYGAAVSGGSVDLPPTEALSRMHYITALHPTNDSIGLRNNMTMAGVSLPTNVTAVALGTGKPFVMVTKFGQGRAVQWASDDWMALAVLGPLAGLDDLVWRGMVWAARKPFAMRALPNFVTARVDDVAGPFWWVHIANEVGFKPFLAMFVADVSPTNIADLRTLVTSGDATASPHSFNGGNLIYFDHGNLTPFPDNVLSNNLYAAQQWHLTNGIPMSKIIATHYSEMGVNAFAGLIGWGTEYFPIEVIPGSLEYFPPIAPWLIAGPYRLYETPGQGQSNLPMYYADFLTVPGHPEMSGQFFNCYTEIRDVGCGQWCPDNNNISTSISQGTAIVKRGLDSRVLATLFSHDWKIQNTPSVPNSNPITPANFRTMMQGISNNLAPYQPIYVTLEYGDQYVRATRTSRLVSADFNIASGVVTATLSGTADLATLVQVFTGADNSITNVSGTVPAFSNSITAIAATIVVPPVILSSPLSRTNDAGTTASFLSRSGGTPPLSYRWFRNGTNLLSDGGNLSGAVTATLRLDSVLGADAAAYSIFVSNTVGAVTSAPPAVLSVIDPVITRQPVSRTNHAGTTASFNVGVNGTAPAFQWMKNGAPIDQATNPLLALPLVSGADAALYNLIVSNAYGNLASATAGLSVVSPLLIQSLVITNGSATITWSAIPGNNYTVQQKNALDGSNWNDLLPPITAVAATAAATNSLDGWTHRFYRVYLAP